MTRLGPYETAPRLAVAVSGGADSLALTLLAADWARSRGGEALALTVDHRLRPDSTAEAARLGGWLAERGIAHRILAWEGEKPVGDLQAAARTARHGLLGEFCRVHGVLHLLLGHHREDQAETLLLRLGRGSGADGLAAMAAERATSWGRLLRPLLDVPRARLRATLAAQGQDWIEDSSNANTSFARVRLRRLLPDLAAEGLGVGRLCATAGRMGRVRAALERQVAEAACRHVTLHLAGFATLRWKALADLPEEIALRLLARLLALVAGGQYGPRLERLERLLTAILNGQGHGRTLAGCRLVETDADLLVCREPSRVAPPVALEPGTTVIWDGRFRAEIADAAPSGLFLGALGGIGLRRLDRDGRLESLPACVRSTLPTLFDEDGVSAVPHLGYNRRVASMVLRRLDAEPRLRLTETGLSLSRPESALSVGRSLRRGSGLPVAEPGRTRP